MRTTTFKLRGQSLLFLLATGLAGCESSPTTQNANAVSSSPTPSDVSPINVPLPNAFSQIIEQYRPAVAVRDTSCIACHGIIQGSIFTDFGSPDAWFLNGYGSPTAFGNVHYTAIDWQTFQAISGQVLIPEVNLPNSFVQPQITETLAVGGTTSLEDYLTRTDIKSYWGGNSWLTFFDMPAPSSYSYTANVDPVAGAAPVVPTPSLYIGAPTATQVLAVVPASTQPAPWVQVKGASSQGLNGFSIVTGLNGISYVMTTSPINCSGEDVVVNGTLLISNGQFYAEQGGCRLYVTGSVFIEGPINYLSSGASPDPTENIQISSATAIFMGVGLNGEAVNGSGQNYEPGKTPLHVRLFDDDRANYYFRQAPNAATYSTYANGIYAEATNIGLPLLQDASVPGASPSALSAAKQRRSAIDYEHILLNAPMIQSRYLGTVLGMVIGESATFSLGEFSTIFDPVFASVPILPGFPIQILCVGNSCNTDGNTNTNTDTNIGTITTTSTVTGTTTDTGTDTTTNTSSSTTTSTSTATATLSIVGFDLTTTNDSADIIWQTPNVPATGVIYWGLSPSQLSDSMAEGAGYVTTHSVSVAGLVSGTVYYFQATSTDQSGNKVTSNIITKQTK
jgi:hypothetical protein